MCDHQEIANLLYEYGYRIDAGDFAGIGQLLGDARLIADGAEMEVRGADAIAAHYASTTRLYEDDGTPKTKHVFTNMQIVIDEGGDTARARTNYMVFQATDALSLQPIITGHYEHKFEKRGDAWRFSEKKFFVDQVGDLSHHLLFDLSQTQTDSPGDSQKRARDMPTEIRMPELGSDMTEADLVQWLVAVGDRVVAGDLIAEIETDKATVEFESPLTGVIVELCVAAPATGVKVGELIARVEEAASEAAAPAPPPSPSAQPPAPAPAPAPAARPVAVPEPAARPESDGVSATALARRVAERDGVDLRSVEPSGARGRVTKADVEAVTAETAAPEIDSEQRPTRPPGAGAPLSRMRRTVAKRMSEAKREVPHFYLEIRCDAKELLAVRGKLNETLERPGLSVNDFCVAAAARALRDVPEANVAWRGDSIERFVASDVAVAVATDDGLITPVLRDAASLGLVDVSTRLRALIERARTGQLSPSEYQGGFAVSNLGMFGVTAVWPIVNPPHACILGVGAVERVPVVEGDAVVPGVRMTCTLSADHRAVDGAVGARLLAAFRRYVEDPLEMIL